MSGNLKEIHDMKYEDGDVWFLVEWEDSDEKTWEKESDLGEYKEQMKDFQESFDFEVEKILGKQGKGVNLFSFFVRSTNI